MNISKRILIISTVSILGFSQASYAGGKDFLSTLIGAGGGAWAGSNIGKGKGRIVSIAVGTLLGAAVGNSVGTSLSNADAYANNNGYNNYAPASYNTYGNYQPNGYYSNYQQETWVAPMQYTNNYNPNYNQAPVSYNVNYNQGDAYNNSYCREYINNVRVGGRTQQSYGKACLMPDGSWRVAN